MDAEQVKRDMHQRLIRVVDDFNYYVMQICVDRVRNAIDNETMTETNFLAFTVLLQDTMQQFTDMMDDGVI